MFTLPSFVYSLLHFLRLCWNAALSLLAGLFGGFGGGSRGDITFDSGVRVRVGKQIAEGGFSYVFEAYGVSGAGIIGGEPKLRQSSSVSSLTINEGGDSKSSSQRKKYALKRINCCDRDIVRSCRREAGVHQLLDVDHPNLLALLGLKFDDENGKPGQYCFMLFPYVPLSLRGNITERNLLEDVADARRRHFTTGELLRLFGGIVDALIAMHAADVSHRDVKLENILLEDSSFRDSGVNGGGGSGEMTPVLMDFGSAGPLTASLSTRANAHTAVEKAASNTTASYRPPELYDGGLRHGKGEEDLDYGRVDVWSLGCVLFGIMHGASPFEMEFRRGGYYTTGGGDLVCAVRVVECTHNKILGTVPDPPPPEMGDGVAATGDGSNGRYPPELYGFVRYMTNHNRAARPDVLEVDAMLDELYLGLLGEHRRKYEPKKKPARRVWGNDGDFDSLLESGDFV